MSKAYEISIWEPNAGKFEEFMETIKSLTKAFVEAGVSRVELLTGVAGKDMFRVVVIQHFKGLADNGAVNESIGDQPGDEGLARGAPRRHPRQAHLARPLSIARRLSLNVSP